MKQRQTEDRCSEKWRNVFSRRATLPRWGLASRWYIARSLRTDIPLAPQTRRYISRPNRLISIRHPPPPPPNYKSIKLWYIVIVFLLPQILYHRLRYSAPSFSSFPSPFLFYRLIFHPFIIFPLSVSSHSFIISIIITSVITNINLHNQNLILLFVLLITVQSLPPTTILSYSALHPFSSPSTSYPLR